LPTSLPKFPREAFSKRVFRSHFPTFIPAKIFSDNLKALLSTVPWLYLVYCGNNVNLNDAKLKN